MGCWGNTLFSTVYIVGWKFDQSSSTYYLSPICVLVLDSELLNEGISRDESTTISLCFMPSVAVSALYEQLAWYIHRWEGTKHLQYGMYGIGMRHYVHVLNGIWSMYRVIQAASVFFRQTQHFMKIADELTMFHYG